MSIRFRNHADLPHFSRGPVGPRGRDRRFHFPPIWDIRNGSVCVDVFSFPSGVKPEQDPRTNKAPTVKSVASRTRDVLISLRLIPKPVSQRVASPCPGSRWRQRPRGSTSRRLALGIAWQCRRCGWLGPGQDSRWPTDRLA